MNAQTAILEVYSQLWNYLTIKRPSLNLLIKSRIRYDQGKINPRLVNPGAESYPMLMIEMGDFTDSMYTDGVVEETFASEFDPAASDCLVTITQVYKITLVSRTLQVGEWDFTAVEMVQAIKAAGPRLGLPYVTGVGSQQRGIRGTGGVKASVKVTDKDESRGTMRFQTELPLLVEMMFESRDMI